MESMVDAEPKITPGLPRSKCAQRLFIQYYYPAFTMTH